MLLQIPSVLNAAQITHCRNLLGGAEWIDGRNTAGYQGVRVKNNEQLAENSPLARELGDLILAALERNPLFISATLPARVYPPMFNRYVEGRLFGNHVDNAVRLLPGLGLKFRTDISATLFLCEPDTYEGGELLIDDTYGTHSVKLPAGDMVIYPSTSLHRVNPVTSGARIASFFWIQSMIREDAERTLMFDLDVALQRLNADVPGHPSAVQLTGVYHNLLRRWADV